LSIIVFSFNARGHEQESGSTEQRAG
jgi:hypothetical protein